MSKEQEKLLFQRLVSTNNNNFTKDEKDAIAIYFSFNEVNDTSTSPKYIYMYNLGKELVTKVINN